MSMQGCGRKHAGVPTDRHTASSPHSMGRIFEFLGMSVGFLPDVAMDDVTIAERQAAVDADVTYSTAQVLSSPW